MSKVAILKPGEFLPEGYVMPDKKKQFMKFVEGTNRFRVVSACLTGWVVFSEEKKSFRKPMDEPFTQEELEKIKPGKNEDGSVQNPKHFWAFIAWNYETESLKVFDVSQSSIMKGMKAILDDEDYGADASKYDFVVSRKGTTRDNTEYTIMPKVPKALTKKVLDAIEPYKETLDITVLMEGEYPFETYPFEK